MGVRFMLNFQKKKFAYIFFPLALIGLPKNKRKHRSRKARVVDIVARAVVPGLSIANDIADIKENFDVVEHENLYRSAQLRPRKLRKVIRDNNIKTIVNLRGENPDQAWWQNEQAVAKETGVNFYNIPMSAKQFPSKENLIKLLDIYDNAPRPIYIHCRSGRDRTGEAAALYVLEKMNKPAKAALKQLSFFKYQHVKKLYPKKRVFIKRWRGKDWLLNGGYEQDVLGKAPTVLQNN